jgi:N-carbamoyl-L-amino-acid hydrolase
MIGEPALKAAANVDEARLWQRHMDMARFGARPDGGVCRQALTVEDRQARALLLDWARSYGFEASVDGIANLFVRRPGRDKDAEPILTGSHMDSQPSGGRFDGIYGVLAGFEAMAAIEEAGVETERPIELVAWTNEEGGRFAPGAMGSAVFTGARPIESCLDIEDGEGVRLADALEATLAETPDLARRSFNFPVAAYVESHIEQGPRLEVEGLPIGVVTGIQGVRWYKVEVFGEAAHAGAAPLHSRKDALRDAVAAIQALQDLMADPDDVVRFTVGRVVIDPNSPNTVPMKVEFSIDFRHPDADTLERLGSRIEAVANGAAKACTVAVTETFRLPPCHFEDRIVSMVDAAAEALGLARMRLPSGPFHDAQFVSAICPTGMIFVPCEKGVSHNPAENAKPADLAAGTRVLAATLVELASP